MKYVVTGGTGFLGRHVAWRLAAGGHDVTFTGRDAAAAEEVQRYSPQPIRWTRLVHGAPDAVERLTKLACGADGIIHCAALSAPWGAAADFLRANVTSTEEVILACRRNGVGRLVHVSTPSIYFEFRDQFGVREDEPLPEPVNEYARTKRIAEERVRAAGLRHAVILRPRALFGPWDRTLMPRLQRVMQRGPIPLMRGGRAMLDLTCVDNAVDAVCLALERPLPRQVCCYNVSNGEPIALEDLLALVARTFLLPLRTRRIPWTVVAALAAVLEAAAKVSGGKEPLLTLYSAGVLAYSQTLDLEAIRTELGYRPRVPLAEGMLRHAQWWRAHEASSR
jgi:nucleoside-diphosphate-sugar epimerase